MQRVASSIFASLMKPKPRDLSDLMKALTCVELIVVRFQTYTLIINNSHIVHSSEAIKKLF